MFVDSGFPAHRLRVLRHGLNPFHLRTGSAPTSAAEVECVLAFAYVGIRVATLVQMIPALPQGVRVSPHPVGYIALWLAAAATTAVVTVLGLRRRRPPPSAVIVVDVLLTVLFLIGGAYTVPVEHRIGSWVGWAPGYALSVVLAVGGLRTADWCAAVGSVSVAFLYYVADAVTHATRPTIVGDTLTLLALGAVARLLVRYIRRVAVAADVARAEVAELARREEEYRAQLTMHNAATIMHLLADPALPPATRVQLSEQATIEVRRLRAYLRGGPGGGRGPTAGPHPPSAAGPGRVSIRDVLESAMVGFADLGLEPALDLADGVSIGADAGEAVRGAVAGVLHNVRRHAAASMVIVHADADPEAGRWIVTIRDDGVGFEPATTAFGTGLRQQVIAELDRHALGARIESTPGLGTRVTIEGKLEP